MSFRIECDASRHTAPLNDLLLNRPLEVCDANLWQLTVVGRAADCIRTPFGLRLDVGMRTGGVIQG